MKNQWRIILGLVLTLLIVIFAMLNTMTVKLNFGFSEISAPLIIVVIGSAFVGSVIIALVTTGTIWQQRRENKQLQKQVTQLNQEIEKNITEKKEELEREYNNKVAELTAAHTIYPKETSSEENTDWHG